MVATDVVLTRLMTILRFPVDQPRFLPSLLPILVGVFVLELYFGRYQHEELGWNSAVSNAVLLITTALSLIWELELVAVGSGPRATVAYGVLGLGLFILLLNFYHIWPPRVAYSLSSAFLTYTLTYLTIAVVYTTLPLDQATGLAAGTFLAGFYIAFKLVKHVVPKPYTGDGDDSRYG